MRSDDELVERMAKAICLERHGGYPVNIKEADDQWRLIWWPTALRVARAALQVVKEEGWTPPSKSADEIFLELRGPGLTDSKQSASGYRVK